MFLDMTAKIQLQALINLAISDMHFADEERELIYTIGQAHGLERKKIDEMISDPKPIGDVSILGEEDRFQMLYNIVQLMKIDRKVYVVEIKYCEDIATRLGYNKKVIKELSAKIYANPAITTDRDYLRDLVRGYKEN